MRSTAWLTLRKALLLTVAALVLAALSRTAQAAPSAANPVRADCAASPVHYERGPGALAAVPWFAASGGGRAVVGFASYYQSTSLLADARANGSQGLVALSGVAAPVTWLLRRPVPVLWLTAGQLDSSGQVGLRATRVPGSARRQFRSALSLPAGCWRLSLRAGALRASFVVLSLAPAAHADCGATPLHTDAVPGLPSDRPWTQATSANGRIYGSLFYDSPSSDQTLAIYSGGKTPQGGVTKILWTPSRSLSILTVAGRRLDGAGRFQQTLDAASSAGTRDFPSVIDVPGEGCWLLRLTSDDLAGVVVLRAVPSA
jgi:hypothetical protein